MIVCLRTVAVPAEKRDSSTGRSPATTWPAAT